MTTSPSNQTDTIQTLSITLSHHIHPRQVHRWRGAFLEMIGLDNELFHNHNNTPTNSKNPTAVRYHYRYPLIQYYEQNGVGKILGINEGRDALLDVLGNENQTLTIRWNNKPLALQVTNVHPSTHTFKMLDQPRKYRIHKWMALNAKNYQRWQDCKNLQQRIQLLDRILANHLIGVFKELQYNWPSRLEVNLQMLHQAIPISYKGIPLFAFHADFTANVDLPSGLAIGNKVSQGYGYIISLEKNKSRRSSIIRK